MDAYYNKGISYLNMAVIKKDTACNNIKDKRFAEDRKAIQELYAQAMPCMEKVRELQPDMVDRWASPLCVCLLLLLLLSLLLENLVHLIEFFTLVQIKVDSIEGRWTRFSRRRLRRRRRSKHTQRNIILLHRMLAEDIICRRRIKINSNA